MQDVLVFAEGEETGKTDSSITLDRASKLVNVVMALLGYKEEWRSWDTACWLQEGDISIL